MNRSELASGVPHRFPHTLMLAELLRYAFLRCPPWARSLGLAHEQVAITFRHRRAAAAWAPHLEASRNVIREAAKRCRQTRRAWVIGAGDCLDVPVAELANRFDEVVLTDVVLGPAVRRLARRSGGRVRAEVWDATGVLSTLAAARQTLTPAEAEALFAHGDPGPIPGGEPDLVVSANCLSQLGAVPMDRFPGAGEDLVARCAAAAARRHVHWLAARTGERVLIADLARLDVAADGRELQREQVPGVDALRSPDQTWRWSIAPAPELSREYHRVHEVGAWIDGPKPDR